MPGEQVIADRTEGVDVGALVETDADRLLGRHVGRRADHLGQPAGMHHRLRDTEVGDEESYYEVEVTTDEGQTDVQLDRDFNVVSSEGDSDEGED